MVVLVHLSPSSVPSYQCKISALILETFKYTTLEWFRTTCSVRKDTACVGVIMVGNPQLQASSFKNVIVCLQFLALIFHLQRH